MSKDPRVQGSKVTRVQGSMAQAAKLSMHPSSWISKIGMHANTFLIESFKRWSLASGAARCSCFPFSTGRRRPMGPRVDRRKDNRTRHTSFVLRHRDGIRESERAYVASEVNRTKRNNTGQARPPTPPSPPPHSSSYPPSSLLPPPLTPLLPHPPHPATRSQIRHRAYLNCITRVGVPRRGGSAPASIAQ